MNKKEVKCTKIADYSYIWHFHSKPQYVCTEHLVMISAAARMEGRVIFFTPLEEAEMKKGIQCGQLVYILEEDNGENKDDAVPE